MVSARPSARRGVRIVRKRQFRSAWHGLVLGRVLFHMSAARCAWHWPCKCDGDECGGKTWVVLTYAHRFIMSKKKWGGRVVRTDCQACAPSPPAAQTSEERDSLSRSAVPDVIVVETQSTHDSWQLIHPPWELTRVDPWLAGSCMDRLLLSRSTGGHLIARKCEDTGSWVGSL